MWRRSFRTRSGSLLKDISLLIWADMHAEYIHLTVALDLDEMLPLMLHLPMRIDLTSVPNNSIPASEFIIDKIIMVFLIVRHHLDSSSHFNSSSLSTFYILFTIFYFQHRRH